MPQLNVNEHFYDLFFEWDFNILFCIGGYGSGKSHEIFSKAATKLCEEPLKAMVVRKEFSTLKDSCFADLEEAFDRIGQYDNFKFNTSPLKIEREIKAGKRIKNKKNRKRKKSSKIIFRGLDNIRKIKSVKSVDLIIVEEADEISLLDLKELVKRLRGNKGWLILMSNPVSRASSVYKYFFTSKGKGFNEQELYKKRRLEKIETLKLADGREAKFKTIVHHSTYRDNIKNLPESFIMELENETDPRIRRIALDGQFGADGDLVLYNAVEDVNVYEKYVKGNKKLKRYTGLDWGFVTSYTAAGRFAIDESTNTLYVYWEYYERDKTNPELKEDLKVFKKTREKVKADSNEEKTIKEFRNEGFNFRGADKGPGSGLYGVKKLRSFSKIIIDKRRCPNAAREAQEWTFPKNKDGEIIENWEAMKRHYDPHFWDCGRYALEDYKWKNTKARLKDITKYQT